MSKWERKWRLRLVGFFVKIWFKCDCLRLYPPEEVRLKRLAAPRLVLSLGMGSVSRSAFIRGHVTPTLIITFFFLEKTPLPSAAPPLWAVVRPSRISPNHLLHAEGVESPVTGASFHAP
jgi:hypothetical protein